MQIGVVSVSPAAIVASTSRRAQPLNPWLIDIIKRCASVGVPLQLQATPDTVLTPPAWAAICDAGRWVVRPGDTADQTWDGLTGEGLSWDGASWRGTGEAVADWLTQTSEKQGGAGAGVQVLASLAVQHKADPATVLGQAADALAAGLTGESLHGWGVGEPVTQPWDTTTLTSHIRRLMPGPVQLVAASPTAVATVTYARTELGVSETVTFHARASADISDTVVVQVREHVARLLAEIAAQTPLAFALAHTRIGRADLMVPPRIEQAPEPAVVYFGPRAVRALDRDLLTATPLAAPVHVGHERAPGMLFRLGDRTRGTGDSGWADYAALVEHLGAEKIHAAAPDLASQVTRNITSSSRNEGVYSGGA